MTNIGRGQRELIIGDQKTGKSAVCLDTIINQRQHWGTDKQVKCIYVAIGQKATTVREFVGALEENGALEYTVVVSAPADLPASFKYVAPYAGSAMGQHWMYKGEHALIVFDDLSKQAEAYREISCCCAAQPAARPTRRRLLPPLAAAGALRQAVRRPGRRLADRPADHRDQGQRHLGLHPDQRHLDHRRPDLPGGRPVQPGRPAGHQRRHLGLAGRRQRPDQGHAPGRGHPAHRPGPVPGPGGVRPVRLRPRQGVAGPAGAGRPHGRAAQAGPVRAGSVEKQVIAIWAGTNGYLDDIQVEDVRRFEAELLEYVDASHPDVGEHIRNQGTLPDEVEAKLKEAVTEFKGRFRPSAGAPPKEKTPTRWPRAEEEDRVKDRRSQGVRGRGRPGRPRRRPESLSHGRQLRVVRRRIRTVSRPRRSPGPWSSSRPRGWSSAQQRVEQRPLHQPDHPGADQRGQHRGDDPHPLLEQRDEVKAAAVSVVTSDRAWPALQRQRAAHRGRADGALAGRRHRAPALRHRPQGPRLLLPVPAAP